MINYPVTYHPGFFTNLLPAKEDAKKAWGKAKKITLAVLPLFGLLRSFRAPLTVMLSGIRSLTHGAELANQIREGNAIKGALHLCHATVATAAIGLFFLNPVLSYLASTSQDMAIHLQELVMHAASQQGHLFALEKIAFIALDALFLASFCYGAITITAACLLLQVALDLYLCINHIKKGRIY